MPDQALLPNLPSVWSSTSPFDIHSLNIGSQSAVRTFKLRVRLPIATDFTHRNGTRLRQMALKGGS